MKNPGGYIMVDCEELDLTGGSTPQTVSGLYQKCEKAMKTGKQIQLCNCVFGEGISVTPISAMLNENDGDIVATTATLQIWISEDDSVLIVDSAVIDPLEIITQPQDVTGAIGTLATFTVAANYTSVAYQWQYFSNDGWKEASTGTGSNSDEYSIEITALRDGRKYRCVVTRGTESVESDEATLTVAT